MLDCTTFFLRMNALIANSNSLINPRANNMRKLITLLDSGFKRGVSSFPRTNDIPKKTLHTPAAISTEVHWIFILLLPYANAAASASIDSANAKAT